MAMNQLDLWPTMTTTATTQNTPTSILRIQADLLREKTDGLVEAVVIQGDVWDVPSALSQLGLKGDDGNNCLVYSFSLIAPALEHYRYTLFRVIYPIEMYPLLINDSPEGDIKVRSEDEFISALRKIFAHEKTQRVIQALIAQSRA
jgi:hypothetical protein